MYTYYEQKGKTLFGDIIEYLKAARIYNNSDYVKLAEQINRDELCEPIKKAYCTNNGRPSINVRMMLALEILKHLLKLSDIKLVKQLQANIEVKYFCGVKNLYEDTKIEPSSLTHFRNRLSKHPEIIEKIQNIHLIETVKKLPKKKQGQYDQDSTVIEENIKYPNDVDLLHSVIEKGGQIIDKIKKTGKKIYKKTIVKGRRIAKKLKLTYHFTKKKSKDMYKFTKKELIDIANGLLNTMDNIKGTISKRSSEELQKYKKKLEDFIGLSKEVITQQIETLKTKYKIKDRIVSLHKPYVRPIVKGKQGKKVQFGAKAHIGMIGGRVAMGVDLSRENKHDNEKIIKGIEKVEGIRGKPPSEVGYDKGGRGQEVYEYLEKKGIINGIQGSSEWKKLPKNKKKRMYNRRAFNENIINDVLNHRGVNKNRYKQENANINLIFGCIASNLIRIR